MKPLIKYRGGKSKEIPYLIKHIRNMKDGILNHFLVEVHCFFI